VQEKAVVHVVKILEDVIDSLGIETRRATFKTVDFVSFGKKEFGQVRTVLACTAGD
jgi:hypothetical protein